MTDPIVSQGEVETQTVGKDSFPNFYANCFAVSGSGNDIKITFIDSMPKVPPDSGASPRRLIVNGVLSVSYHAAKDLGQMLIEAVSRFEEDNGEIKTPYLKDRIESVDNKERDAS